MYSDDNQVIGTVLRPDNNEVKFIILRNNEENILEDEVAKLNHKQDI